jgi:nucleotide-binding universal stress UspA family protein
MASTSPGAVLIAYDGSSTAQLAIQQAGEQLAPGREAIVLCVWQPVDVGFVPVGEQHFDAQDATAVEQAAAETAAHGAALAQQAGFQARAETVEASPTWKGICQVADAGGAGLVVMGAHQRGGIIGHLLGSVSTAVLKHSPRPVLIVREGAEA